MYKETLGYLRIYYNAYYYSFCHSSCGCVSWKYLSLNDKSTGLRHCRYTCKTRQNPLCRAKPDKTNVYDYELRISQDISRELSQKKILLATCLSSHIF